MEGNVHLSGVSSTFTVISNSSDLCSNMLLQGRSAPSRRQRPDDLHITELTHDSLRELAAQKGLSFDRTRQAWNMKEAEEHFLNMLPLSTEFKVREVYKTNTEYNKQTKNNN